MSESGTSERGRGSSTSGGGGGGCSRVVLSAHPDKEAKRVRFTVTSDKPAYFGRVAETMTTRIARSGYPGDVCVLKTERVSGAHLKVWFEAGAFYVKDLKSANGTLLLTPSPHGVLETFLGNRHERAPPVKLEPLSVLVLAGDLRLVVESIALAPGHDVDLGHSLTTAAEFDGTVTAGESATDLALHVVAGPGAGSTFLMSPGHTYLIGRESSKPVTVRRAGVVRFSIGVPKAPLSARHALKRSHAELSFLSPIERRHSSPEARYKVTARGSVGYLVRDCKDELDLNAVAWEELAPGGSLLFAFDDLVKIGNVVFLVTSNHAVPRKIAPPQLMGCSPVDLLLSWGVQGTAASVTSFMIQATSKNPAKAAARDWKLFSSVKPQLLISELSPSTEYWVQVRARNAAGLGPWSRPAVFRTSASWSDDECDDDESYDYEYVGDAGGAGGGEGGDGESGLELVANSSASDVTAVLGLFSHREGNELRFVKAKLLGQGGQAVVYLGIDLDDGGMYAVKEVSFAASDEKEVANASMLVETVSMLQELEHEHIVRYKGVAQSEGMLRIFQEYCASGSVRGMLDDLDEGVDGLPEVIVARYTAQILRGLAYLHANSILHRDIKAANVLVHVAGDVTVLKISDFGLAWQAKTGTGTRGTVGTPYFMAPEVVRNTTPAPAGDIWALGCTVYEMLVGAPPLLAMGDVRAFFYIGSVLARQDYGHQLPQSVAVSPQCADFLRQCFAVDPASRTTAEALLSHEWLAMFAQR
ncbi:STE/STE11 protein kinase [Thecamonas trahens ATCC 50062]|uniref:STE/STE11 protein kinase n=1 Tax=Thecamonas trahens ATCC 50062 TaxID=461836 RepID=A0A0L0D8R1_THETB|nr:STE/STE11 protein kinase [Thecamonas trahens ATCC 50062]KNC48605.1 STE/STE11 protein kinase [Thecamonas trahens ATCC 50062]|eukprot:XP_013762661.1 STE/STE11 protein kinase [Thecamonas trahens ATCC 50062]